MDEVRHAGEIFQVIELDLPGLQADEHGSLGCFPCFGNEEFNGGGSQPGGEDTVERRRIASLLQVSQDGLTHIENLFAFLRKERAHETGSVEGVSVLAADHHTQSLAVLESVDQRGLICLQITECHSFFGQVDPLGARGETAHLRQIPAMSPHHFDENVRW